MAMLDVVPQVCSVSSILQNVCAQFTVDARSLVLVRFDKLAILRWKPKIPPNATGSPFYVKVRAQPFQPLD